MRIVMAGSSGHLGSALRGALEGNDIVRLVRRTPHDDDEIQWDPYRGPLDASVLDGVDAVVNLCGVPVGGRRWNAAFKQRLRTSRVVPTKVLSEAVARAEVPILVNASASGWYGDRADVPLDESAPAAADYLGRMALEWERATAPAQEAGARVVRLRSGHVLHRRNEVLKRMLPTHRWLLGGRFGNGRQYLPWISRRDWVSAVEFLLDSDVNGPVNMVGPTPATNREFVRALAAVVNRPAPWVIPGWAVKLVAGEAATEMLRSTKVIPAVLESKGFEFQDRTVLDALEWSLDG